jgi:hypothetical protein
MLIITSLAARLEPNFYFLLGCHTQGYVHYNLIEKLINGIWL